MSNIVIVGVVIVIMVFFNALYVAAEFSAVSVRRNKIRISRLADSGSQLAKNLVKTIENPQALDNYVATSQVGITISSLILGAYGQDTVATILAPFLSRFGNLADEVALSISTTTVLILLSIVQVVMGELLPKSIAIQYPEKVALLTAFPMQWSYFILRPFIWFFNGSGNLLLQLLRFNHNGHEENILAPEEIEILVSQSHEGGLLDDDEQQMLRNAFRLRELKARQVMAPRTRLVAAPLDSTVDEVLALVCDAGISRIPVYENSIDTIIGFVHIKDLFRLNLHGQQDIQSILREVIRVPDSLPIADVWTSLNHHRQYIAIVIDEYGGTAGMITIEDLLEEIFGELQDEFDDEVPLISSDKEGRIHLRADLLVSDVNEYLDLNLLDDEADTLGGLVFGELGRLPEVGDEVTVGKPEIIIRVEVVEGRSISEVSLKLPQNHPPMINNEWSWTGL